MQISDMCISTVRIIQCLLLNFLFFGDRERESDDDEQEGKFGLGDKILPWYKVPSFRPFHHCQGIGYFTLIGDDVAEYPKGAGIQ